jgi:hypothetical protein
VVSNNLEVADAVIGRGGWIKLSDYAGSATVGAPLVRKTSDNLRQHKCAGTKRGGE